MTAQPPSQPSSPLYVPPVPDGPARPWTQSRLSRWAVVIPADLCAALLSVLFTVAAVHRVGEWRTIVVNCAVLVGLYAYNWLMLRRQRPHTHHAEVIWPDGVYIAARAWIFWMVASWWIAPDVSMVRQGGETGAHWVTWVTASAGMTVFFTLGWRVLYGWYKAHESIVPRPLARRMAGATAQDGAHSAQDRGQDRGQDRVQDSAHSAQDRGQDRVQDSSHSVQDRQHSAYGAQAAREQAASAQQLREQ